MSNADQGLVHSIRTRLLNHAKQTQQDYNRVLERYGLERLLYRLSQSRYAEQFVLKGALMMVAWLGETVRPTRDADLLGFGELGDEALTRIFREVCDIRVESDGVVFDPESIRINDIRDDDTYGGRRIRLSGRLGNARLSLQVDIGIGDAVTPEPEWLDYPSLLEMPPARLRAYRPETSIAEKFHIMVTFGLATSRMKDFFDIAMLAARESFDGDTLAAAIVTTFERRGTELPKRIPDVLRDAFSADSTKQRQWAAFIERNSLQSVPLAETISQIQRFLWPVVQATVRGEQFSSHWPPGGPWQVTQEP